MRQKNKLSGLITKYLSHYISPKLILLFDVVLSILASALVLLLVYILFRIQVDKSFFFQYLFFAAGYSLVAFVICSTHNIIVRHTDFRDTFRFSMASIIKVLLLAVTWIVIGNFRGFTYLILVSDFLVTLLSLLLSRFSIVLIYGVYKAKVKERMLCKRVLIYETSEKSVALISRFKESTHYEVVGFLVPKEGGHYHLKLSGIPLYEFNTEEDFATIANNLSIGGIIFSREADVSIEKNRLLKYATELGISVLITPSTEEYNPYKQIREVKIEDLLERPVIRMSKDKIRASISGKVVLVTGAAGSIGSELCRQLAGLDVSQLILFDNAETPMHNFRLELERLYPDLSFFPIIGDVRSVERVDYVMKRWHPQVVFHAAAYKHVPLMEENPCEAALVNVCGSRNVAEKCVEYGVEMMVMISTDKAVNPTNVMGCTKRLAEIYVQSLGLHLAETGHKGTKFVTTRFGNVLGSNGSVIPRFREQIKAGGPVTVTDPRITRFFMTIPEACSLVMEAAVISQGNEIFVFDMGEPVKIDHLARRMIELAGYVPDKDIKIVYTGLRPGEKLYEEVLSDEENTLPTPHERIRIAKVRDYSYEQAVLFVKQLHDMAIQVNIPDLIQLMKKIVPEYISQNSAYEAYDKK